jgi:hypothetical protein
MSLHWLHRTSFWYTPYTVWGWMIVSAVFWVTVVITATHHASLP